MIITINMCKTSIDPLIRTNVIDKHAWQHLIHLNGIALNLFAVYKLILILNTRAIVSQYDNLILKQTHFHIKMKLWRVKRWPPFYTVFYCDVNKSICTCEYLAQKREHIMLFLHSFVIPRDVLNKLYANLWIYSFLTLACRLILK